MFLDVLWMSFARWWIIFHVFGSFSGVLWFFNQPTSEVAGGCLFFKSEPKSWGAPHFGLRFCRLDPMSSDKPFIRKTRSCSYGHVVPKQRLYKRFFYSGKMAVKSSHVQCKEVPKGTCCKHCNRIKFIKICHCCIWVYDGSCLIFWDVDCRIYLGSHRH